MLSFLSSSSTTRLTVKAFRTTTSTVPLHQQPRRLNYATSVPRLHAQRGKNQPSSDYDPNNNHDDTQDEILSFFNSNNDRNRPMIQWYPGHIAKATRMLQETLKLVDVIVEVRDARIPLATAHPQVAEWTAGKPRIVVLTHTDAVPGPARQLWNQVWTERGVDVGGNDDDDHNRNNSRIDLQLQNQIKQAQELRQQYTKNDTQGTTKPSSTYQPFLFVNGKTGEGIHSLTRNIFKAGAHVQERRYQRGLKERPLRVGMMGYPNVGKSTIINRLIQKKRTQTANTPGVTRSLQWIRVSSNADTSRKTQQKQKQFELLDSPGIIPAYLENQADAVLVAACNCIGQAAYDNQAVAAALCEWILQLHSSSNSNYCVAAPQWRQQCIQRYKFDPLEASNRMKEPSMFDADENINNRDDSKKRRTGEDMLFDVADATCQGNPEDAARKILQDFRSGRMGPVCLQIPNVEIMMPDDRKEHQRQKQKKRDEEELARERALMAKEKAYEMGLQLPSSKNDKGGSDGKVGKGRFEGW